MLELCDRCGYKTKLSLTMDKGMLCPSCQHITATDPIWQYAESEEELAIKMKEEAMTRIFEKLKQELKK